MNLNALPKVLLHLDINKTLIAEDLTTNKTMEYTISNALAEKTVYKWSDDLKPMSYRDYVSCVLAPGDKVKQREIVASFIPFLETTDYSERARVRKIYDQVMQKMQDAYLVPSFVRLIQVMQEEDIPFRIILRTFGGDIRIGKITQEINKLLKRGAIEHSGRFTNGQLTITDETNCIQTFEKVDEIYRYFRDAQGHIAIQDDWNRWHEDDERARSAKPFIFDPKDKQIVSIFFDDNINEDTGSEYNIIYPMDTNGSPKALDKLLNRNVFVADIIEAILDENYFVDRVNQSLSESRLFNAFSRNCSST